MKSFWHLVFPENQTVWVKDFAPLGGARAWLNADTITEDPEFLNEAYKDDWLAWMRRPDAIEAGLNCYRSQLRGVNDFDEAGLTDEDWKLRVPVLAIGGSQDPIGRPDLMVQATEPWAVAGFESKILDGGHWLPKELPSQVSELLLEFARTG